MCVTSHRVLPRTVPEKRETGRTRLQQCSALLCSARCVTRDHAACNPLAFFVAFFFRRRTLDYFSPSLPLSEGGLVGGRVPPLPSDWIYQTHLSPAGSTSSTFFSPSFLFRLNFSVLLLLFCFFCFLFFSQTEMTELKMDSLKAEPSCKSETPLLSPALRASRLYLLRRGSSLG